MGLHPEIHDHMSREYQSLRVKSPTHKLRHGGLASLVQAGGEQTITRHEDGGYVFFRIEPSGVEVPVENVASAIPKAASIASKLKKTTGSRIVKPSPNVKGADDE